MNKFTLMAEEIMKQKKDNENIDEVILKYASEHNLNKHETQRLIEEYNVGVFLEKLKEGTHHEEYDVASPVEVPVVPSNETSNSELNKAASVYANYNIHSSMFTIDDEDNIFDSSLEKVASFDEYTHEVALKQKDDELSAEAEAELEKIAEMQEKAFVSDVINALVEDIAEASKESEGLTKTAVLILAKEGLSNEAEDVMTLSKFASSDILSAKSEKITDDQKILIGLLKEASEGKAGYVARLIKDVGGGVKGTYNIAKAIVKHPYLTAGTGGTIYYMNSKRAQEPDLQRLQMAVGNYA